MNMHSFLALLSALLISSSTSLASQTYITRIVVEKKMTPSAGDSTLSFSAITSEHPTRSGFSQLADYPSRTVFEGPAGSIPALMSGLRSEGYEVRVAEDLEELSFRGHRIDPSSGSATPPFPSLPYQASGKDGLFILVLRSYLTPSWFSSLSTQGVQLVESLSPSAYLVRIDRARAETLRTQVFVRGLFPVTPAMKFEPPGSSSSESVLRHVLVQAVESESRESLRLILDSYSERPSVEADRSPNGKVLYVAWLSDVDIAAVAYLENVYAISEFPSASPSTERQGLLTLKPVESEGRLELSASLINAKNYWSLLTSRGTDLDDFFNTKIAILDTGFDNGTNTHPDFQFGGSASVQHLTTPWATAHDDQGHGTFVASLITGFTNFDERADSEHYRYSLGIAPGVKLISDKLFQCGAGSDLSTALARIKPHLPDVVNMSWNNRTLSGQPSSCGYTADSQIVDGATRKTPFLFTISAGNTPDDPGGCLEVRGPATAKNAIAVGATEGFTPTAWPNNSSDGVCDWADPQNLPVVRDARNIPSFSARKNAFSMVKPDLVAPSARITGPDSRGVICGENGSAFIYCTEEVQGFPAGDPNRLRYGMATGTSFAAPAVAGAAAVVRKWYYNLTLRPDPSPALVKAILINGARDIGGPPATPPNCPAGAVRNQAFAPTTCIGHIPDAYQGWGMLSLERLLGPWSNYYFNDQDDHPVLGSSVSVWQEVLTINDSTRPVHITLVYTDPAEGASAPAAYDVTNNVDLRVYVASYSHWWYGNSLDPSTGMSRLNVFWSDAQNNVERIIIPAGTYPSGTQIRVCALGTNIVEDIWGLPFGQPSQDFAVTAENAR